MINYILILDAFYKGKKWSSNGEAYEDINWHDDSEKPSKEELDLQWEEVISIRKKNKCKNDAKKLIANTDWAILPDIDFVNKKEFETYRNILRNYIIYPIENPQFPTEPKPIWKNNE